MSRRGAVRALAMLGICALMLVTAGPSPLAAQQADPPAKPTGLTGDISHDRVTLTWDDPGDDSITGYQVRRRHASVNNRDDFQTHVDNTGTNATTYVDTDVVSGERYVYRVKARNANGLSDRSSYFNAPVPHPPEVTVSFEHTAYCRKRGGKTWRSPSTLDADPEREVKVPIETENRGGASDEDYSGVLSQVVFDRGETRRPSPDRHRRLTEDDDGESVLLKIGAGLQDRVSAGGVTRGRRLHHRQRRGRVRPHARRPDPVQPPDPDANDTRETATALGDITEHHQRPGTPPTASTATTTPSTTSHSPSRCPGRSPWASGSWTSTPASPSRTGTAT